MTWSDLKAHIETLTQEQLAMSVQWAGEERGGTVDAFEVLSEDHVDPTGDGMEPVSSYGPGDLDDGEPIVARRGQPLLLTDFSSCEAAAAKKAGGKVAS